MFESVGWGEILLLIVAGLFILGPERLPEAAAWLGRTVRKVREYASGAREQLKSEMGPEFEQFREPLDDLRRLREFNAKTALTKHFSESLGDNSTTANGAVLRQPPVPTMPAPAPLASRPLDYNERPPFDPDAT